MDHVNDLEVTGMTRVAQTGTALENIYDIIYVLQNARTIQAAIVNIQAVIVNIQAVIVNIHVTNSRTHRGINSKFGETTKFIVCVA